MRIERVRELDREMKTGYLLVPTQPIEPALIWATEHGHTGVFPWEGDIGIDPLPMLAQATAFGREVGCYVVNDPDGTIASMLIPLSASRRAAAPSVRPIFDRRETSSASR